MTGPKTGGRSVANAVRRQPILVALCISTNHHAFDLASVQIAAHETEFLDTILIGRHVPWNLKNSIKIKLGRYRLIGSAFSPRVAGE